jgi:hypothetical protein
MKAISLFVLLASPLMLSALALAADVPSRIEITFRVTVGPLPIGQGHDVFEHDGKTYRLTSESKTIGPAALIYRLSVVRVSAGTVTSRGLRPNTYDETRNGKPKRSVRFDWDNKQAQLIDEGEAETVDLPANTWDMASFGYNFAFFPPTEKDLDLFLTDGRRISPYKYTVVGREKIETEIGEIETVHVKKVQHPTDPRAFDVWLAPDEHYAPVRIRFTEKDGTVFDSVMTKIVSSDR